jgi:serine/threonine-protein kinase
MGVVYLGRVEGAAGFSKAVVVKRIIPDVEDMEESTARFIREAQILSNLQHPGIVGVLDFGQENEGYSMVLEYVHGYDLGRWLKYNQTKVRHVQWEEAVFVMLRVLDALHYAHDFRRPDGTPAEVLHRDISPGNILLDLEGRVRLLDFGIARMAEGDAGQYKTQGGVLKGKVAFLAPELFSSQPPSASSDIYACAVVLYQMLAGANPFTAENESKVMWRVIMEEPAPLSALRDDLPLELESALSMALNKDPEDRYGRADDFARELRKCLVRDEAEIAVSLRERLRADFNGDMPGILRLEPLSERDKAWRNSQDRSVLDLTPLRTSVNPRASASRSTVTTIDSPTHSSRPNSPEAVVDSAPLAVHHVPIAQPQWRHILTLGLSIGLVIAVGLGGAMVFFQQRTAAPLGGRFIVVESADRPATKPAAQVAPTSSVPVVIETQVVSGNDDVPQTKRPVARARKPARQDATSLSRTFARRHALLQACFERFAAELQGQPQISVKFEVTEAGKVSSASLVPSSLNGTPLGQCLLRVARGTSFGRLDKSMRFSIPIRARAVGG